MIKIKTTVEITGVLLRTENIFKNAFGNLYDVRIKDVVVMESKQ